MLNFEIFIKGELERLEVISKGKIIPIVASEKYKVSQVR